MFFKIIIYLFYFEFVFSLQIKDDYQSVKSFFKNSKKQNTEEEEGVDDKTFELKALNLSKIQTIGDFEDNKMTIICPFGKQKSDYYYIKWFIDNKKISDRQLRNQTKLRMSLKDNKLLIVYLRAEDTALYSCQLRMKTNSTLEELANNSTNFKLEVYRFLMGGLDIRCPKVTIKLTFLIVFIIFCQIIFKTTKLYLQFN